VQPRHPVPHLRRDRTGKVLTFGPVTVSFSRAGFRTRAMACPDGPRFAPYPVPMPGVRDLVGSREAVPVV
jgi:hypothetical protein